MTYLVILLVIASNIILLNLPIAFTYYLISNNSLFQYTKPYLSIIGNWLSFITLLKYISPLLHCLKAY